MNLFLLLAIVILSLAMGWFIGYNAGQSRAQIQNPYDLDDLRKWYTTLLSVTAQKEELDAINEDAADDFEEILVFIETIFEATGEPL